jgi:hypothetical protein
LRPLTSRHADAHVRASHYTLEVPIDTGTLLVNWLSRSVLELDAEGLATFRSFLGSRARLPRKGDRRDFFEVLRAGLFLVDEQFDELKFLRERVTQDRYDSEELALVIAPTMGCNFGCHYCFQDRAGSAMTPQDEQRLLEYVAERLEGRKRLAVQWFGGEPLQQLDLIERLSRSLMALADQRGILYGAAIVTNGLLSHDGYRPTPQCVPHQVGADHAGRPEILARPHTHRRERDEFVRDHPRKRLRCRATFGLQRSYPCGAL